MSISESLNNLVGVMATLPAAFEAGARKKRPATKEADVTSALSGMSLSTVQTAMAAELHNHEIDGTAHGITAAQLGTYSYTEMDATLAPMPGLDANPISQFGDLSYLSPGVTAFFEGATTNNSAADVAINFEDDGVLTYLRNGTNGSLLGVFYAYVPNALQTLTEPNKTNRRYQPPFFPVGQTAQYVVRTGEGLVAGRLQTADGTLADYFIALTGGTFDDATHTGCFVSPSDWPIPDGVIGELILGNDGVYAIGSVPRTDSSEIFGFQVRFIPTSKLNSGVRVSPQLLTGWTTQSYYGQRVHADTIVIADRTKSLNPADNPMVLGNKNFDNFWAFHDGPASTNSTQRGDGVIRTRITNGVYAADYTSGAEKIAAFCGSFTFNPYNRTAAVDKPGAAPVLVTYKDDGNISITGPLAIDGDFSSVLPVGGWGFRVSTRYHAGTGTWWGVNIYAVVDQANHLGRVENVNGPMSYFDALNDSQRTMHFYIAGINAQYGSAIGGSILGNTLLPGNRSIVWCMGRGRDGNTRRGMVLFERGAYGFNYKSQYNGSYTGYTPNVKRDFLTDISKVDRNFAAIVSEVSASGTVVSSGSYFVEREKNTGFLSVDADLNVSGSVSITQAVYDSVTAAMRVASGLPAAPSGYSSLCIVVPQNTAIPPFGYLAFTTPDMRENHLFAELQITAGSRTGAITGMSVLTVAVTRSYPRVSFMADSLGDLGSMSGGVAIYEGTDCWMVGGAGKTAARRTGSVGSICFRFAIPKSTNRPNWTTLGMDASGIDNSTNYFTAIPGVGFGYNSQYPLASDGYTKLLFKCTARNLAEFNAWNTLGNYVQTSQDVAQGWFIYFTQEIPFLLNGGYGTMKPQTFDLTSIFANPANMTLFLYLTGSPTSGYVYSFTNIDNGDAPGRMLLGVITTGATSITKIDVSKVTRLGMYRISTTNKGKSIPASPGNPSDNSGLLWTS